MVLFWMVQSTGAERHALLLLVRSSGRHSQHHSSSKTTLPFWLLAALDSQPVFFFSCHASHLDQIQLLIVNNAGWLLDLIAATDKTCRLLPKLPQWLHENYMSNIFGQECTHVYYFGHYSSSGCRFLFLYSTSFPQKPHSSPLFNGTRSN